MSHEVVALSRRFVPASSASVSTRGGQVHAHNSAPTVCVARHSRGHLGTNSMSMMCRLVRSAAVVAMVGLCAVSPACAGLKHGIWRGTLVDSLGRTMNVRANVHLVDGRDRCEEFFGRFRCRGVGCPLRRGGVDVM